MVLEIIRIIGALILILFLPGYLFIQAMFPKKNELDEDNDLLYRIILGIAMSIVISILIGFTLGSFGINPNTGKGYFQTSYILVSLCLFSIIMFVLGLYRGAYPSLSRRRKPETELPISEEKKDDFYDAMFRWRELKGKINRLDVRIKEEPKSKKKELNAKRLGYMKQLTKLEFELKKLSQVRPGKKSEVKKLHEYINEWKQLKEELNSCENRIKLSSGELRVRNERIRDDLEKKIDKVEQNISFLRDTE